jgi:hypothetical protein
MSYTLLRATAAGVVLREGHRSRFEAESPAILAAFDRFCAEAEPGIYALRAEANELHVTQRDRSALRDHMPVGFVPSPYFGVGDFAKPAPPCPYDEVRVDGVCTFLTDDLGDEIIEACRGVALAYRDGTFVRAATRFARVTSVVERFLAQAGMGTAKLTASASETWAVANAVAGLVVVGPRTPATDAARRAAPRWNERILETASRA